jgi:Kef-type K+ transport system membrane component KefB
LFDNVFQEIAALLAAAAVASILTTTFRQPAIVGFILLGVVVGPALLGWVSASNEVATFSKLGISVLLFLVGLKLDVRVLRTIGPVAVVAGSVQMLLTALPAFLIARGFGIDATGALYIGLAVMFSSTVVVIKLLSDRREVGALHGQIAIGILILQDIVALVLISAVGMAGPSTGEPQDLGTRLAVLFGLAGGGALVLWLASHHVFLPLLVHLSRSTEAMLLFAIALAVGLGALGEYLGLSKEVGSFLAGLSLAPTRFREAITARLTGLRDFLLLFFFIDFGTNLELEGLRAQLPPAIALSALVLVGKPLTIIMVSGAMCYRKRTGMLAGLSLSQISEFSLILCAAGMAQGHVGREVMGIITLVAALTITTSTYLMQYSGAIYQATSARLKALERRVRHPEDIGAEAGADTRPSVVLFGLGSYGGAIGRRLAEHGYRVLGVDFDPAAVEAWLEDGLPARYGDADDPELLASLPIASADWVVCTVPGRETNTMLLRELRRLGYKGRVALSARLGIDAEPLKEENPDLLLNPNADAAVEAAHLIAERTPSGV